MTQSWAENQADKRSCGSETLLRIQWLAQVTLNNASISLQVWYKQDKTLRKQKRSEHNFSLYMLAGKFYHGKKKECSYPHLTSSLQDKRLWTTELSVGRLCVSLNACKSGQSEFVWVAFVYSQWNLGVNKPFSHGSFHDGNKFCQ